MRMRLLDPRSGAADRRRRPTAVLVKGAERHVVQPDIPGTPYIDVLSPRDGSKPKVNAVVVKVKVHNFAARSGAVRQGAAARRGDAPLLAQQGARQRRPEPGGRREPATRCSSGRVIGRSFDFPKFAGPNGILAERIDTEGQYSPATEPQIYYHGCPRGCSGWSSRCAQNDRHTDAYHAVTHFRIE